MSTSLIHIEGSWEHKIIHAHGSRFHVAVQGRGPLVLFVHGFPTFWWLWRNFLGRVSNMGFTAVAMDMRGYGTSDHTPRGYDPRTLAADIHGVIRALGFKEAIVVGHGVGGLVGWTAATLQSAVIRGLATIGAAHPNALRSAMLTNPAQIKALSYVIGLQRPWLAERSLTRNGAKNVGELLQEWSQPSVIPPDIEVVYREAFLLGKTAHCSLEFHRWALRSIPRPDGRKFSSDMNVEVGIPVLSIHGKHDSSILLSTALASKQWAANSWTSHVIDAGHLLPEIATDETSEQLCAWLAQFQVSHE